MMLSTRMLVRSQYSHLINYTWHVASFCTSMNESCISWNRLVEIHEESKQDQTKLQSFYRTKAMTDQYEQHRSNVLSNYNSMGDYILAKYFNEQTVIDGNTNKLKILDPNSINETYSIQPNNYPYNFEENIKHFLIWSTYQMKEDEIERISLNEILPTKSTEYRYWINHTSLQTVVHTQLYHAHVAYKL